MPWISVYDTVDGPKLRKLYKELNCSKYEALGILNFLWFWGLENADQTGKIMEADIDDIERYLYGHGAGTSISLSDIVTSLVNTGWIDRCEDGLYLHDWAEWQDSWFKAKARREKDNERHRISRANKKQENDYHADFREDDPHDSPDDTPKKPEENEQTPNPDESKKGAAKPKRSKKRVEFAYPESFEQFWDEYPRKDGKRAAYEKYATRIKDGWTDQELLRAAKNYAFVCKKQKTETEFIKHAETFLSYKEPFRDYLPELKSGKANKQPADDGNTNPFKEYQEQE